MNKWERWERNICCVSCMVSMSNQTLSRLFFHIKPEDDWRDVKEMQFCLADLVRR